MVLGPEEFGHTLREITPLIGNYDWMWRILGPRARRTGYIPRRVWRMLLKVISRRRPYFIAESPHGLPFVGDVRDSYSVGMAVTGRQDYDDGIIEFTKQNMPQKDGAFLDIGANVGMIATPVAKYFENRGEVIAFEPSPDTARRAAATFALNKVENVRLFPIAVGEENCQLTFYQAIGDLAMSSAYAVEHNAKMSVSWQETKVACRTLDRLMEEGLIGKVAVVKIDVEGYELQVVRGAAKLIERDQPNIAYEYAYDIAPKIGVTPEHVSEEISRHGHYRFEVLNSDNTISRFPPPNDGCWVVNILCRPIVDK